MKNETLAEVCSEIKAFEFFKIKIKSKYSVDLTLDDPQEKLNLSYFPVSNTYKLAKYLGMYTPIGIPNIEFKNLSDIISEMRKYIAANPLKDVPKRLRDVSMYSWVEFYSPSDVYDETEINLWCRINFTRPDIELLEELKRITARKGGLNRHLRLNFLNIIQSFASQKIADHVTSLAFESRDTICNTLDNL